MEHQQMLDFDWLDEEIIDFRVWLRVSQIGELAKLCLQVAEANIDNPYEHQFWMSTATHLSVALEYRISRLQPSLEPNEPPGFRKQ